MHSVEDVRQVGGIQFVTFAPGAAVERMAVFATVPEPHRVGLAAFQQRHAAGQPPLRHVRRLDAGPVVLEEQEIPPLRGLRQLREGRADADIVLAFQDFQAKRPGKVDLTRVAGIGEKHDLAHCF